MEDHLKAENTTNPVVQDEEGGVGPVSQPEEDVVAAGEEEEEGCSLVGVDYCAAQNGGYHLAPDCGNPGTRLPGDIANGGQEDVEKEEEGNVGRLASGGGISYKVGQHANVVVADGARPT